MKLPALGPTSSEREIDAEVEEFRLRALRVVLWLLPLIALALALALVLDYNGTAIELAFLIPGPIGLAVAGQRALSDGAAPRVVTRTATVTRLGQARRLQPRQRRVW